MKSAFVLVWNLSQIICVATFGIEGEELTVIGAELWEDEDGPSGEGVGTVLVGFEDADGQGLHAAPVSLSNWGTEEGRVACRHFGHMVTTPTVLPGHYLGRNGMVEVRCTGTEPTLLQCQANFTLCCQPAAVNCTEPFPVQPTTTVLTSSSEQSTQPVTEPGDSNKKDRTYRIPVYVPITGSLLGIIVLAVVGMIVYQLACKKNTIDTLPHS